MQGLLLERQLLSPSAPSPAQIAAVSAAPPTQQISLINKKDNHLLSEQVFVCGPL